VDDDNDSNFNGHVFGDLSGNHRMCSFGEWNLCKDIFEKDNMINNLESQLEYNCSEEVIILREKVILLEKQVEILKEKLYANKNEHVDNEVARWTLNARDESAGGGDGVEQSVPGKARSRLSKRRKSS
jgi:hypothetical protein